MTVVASATTKRSLIVILVMFLNQLENILSALVLQCTVLPPIRH